MKILFLGDFFYDYPTVMADVKKIIEFVRRNDFYVILNLETTLGTQGEKIVKRGPNLRSSDCLIDILKQMNCVAVCLANNHTMDYHWEGLAETKRLLEKAEIPYVGAGGSLEEANKPLHINIENKEIILQNFGWDIEETVYASEVNGGCAPLDREEIVKQTKCLRSSSDNSILINIFHWGFEYNVLPMPLDIDFAHKCVDAGCDLVIGHHPHVIQPYERYHEKFIYYSLGNFYFSSKREEFKQGYQNESIDHYGDYGLGVVYDTETNQREEIYVYYDREQKISRIVENSPLSVMDLNELDWKSKDYVDIVKHHAYKPNPVLGLNNRENERMIKKLMFQYSIAGRIQGLKKCRLGNQIYSFLKRLA